jgi:hypothetical protein
LAGSDAGLFYFRHAKPSCHADRSMPRHPSTYISPLAASDKPCDEDEIAIHRQLRPHNIRESDRVTVIARMLALLCGEHPCTFHAG